jgi:adenine-specific DNA-methyltransferase
VVGDEDEDLTRHDKWLCMMYPRLKLLYKLLSQDGTIFISIDHNELFNLKLIMNEIFGERNFIELFSWHKTKSPSNLSHKSKKCIDYILCYEKSKNKIRYKGLHKVNENDNPLIKSTNAQKVLKFPKEALTVTFKGDIHFTTDRIYGTKINKVKLMKDVLVKDGRFEDDLILEGQFVWEQEKLNEEITKNTKIIFKSHSLAPRYDKAEYAEEVPRNLVNEEDEVGTTEEGGTVLKKIFEGYKVFDYPKPPSLLRYLLNFTTQPGDIILDSFAGSGTTAHAILGLNQNDRIIDGRKFILIQCDETDEMGHGIDICNKITAERVKRVIKGYGDKEGTGGCFDFLEIGQPLFNPNGEINELAGRQKINQYIYYTETQQSYSKPDSNNEYLLGKFNDTVYYFFYEEDITTTLDYNFLASLDSKYKGSQYIVYADNCLLPREFMEKKNIVFKKIPRDITKF